MSIIFEPRLDMLPSSQLRLWPELNAAPTDFVLYGGTGLALQIGHRSSEDFDFFDLWFRSVTTPIATAFLPGSGPR